jgi:hypothetical protein
MRFAHDLLDFAQIEMLWKSTIDFELCILDSHRIQHECLVFRVEGVGCWAQGLGCRGLVQGLGFGVCVYCFGCRVSGLGFRV